MFDDPPSSLRRTASGNEARYVRAELARAGSYMIPVGHRVEGPLDPARLKNALHALVARHDALRTRFEITDAEIVALVSPQSSARFHLVTPADPSLEAFRHCALPLIFDNVDPRAPGSLIRLVAASYGDAWRFTIAAHHAITDGFSRGVMNAELLKLYAGESLSPARAYGEFSVPHHRAVGLSQATREAIDALPEPTRLIGDGVGTIGAEETGQCAEQLFPHLGDALRTLQKSTGATRFGILTATYAMGLQGFSASRTASTFFQTEGRKALGAPISVIGPFSNTLPLDLSIAPGLSFADAAKRLSAQTQRIVEAEQEPVLERVLSERKAPSVSLNFFPPARSIRAGALDVGPREFLDRRTEFDLNLVWSEDDGVLTARAYYDPAQLTQARAALFVALQGRILGAALKAPDATCEALLAEARNGHRAAVPLSAAPPAPWGRMHTRVFATAERAPDKVAITTSSGQITYAELAAHALSYTAALQNAGVGEQDRVALLASRNPSLVAAMLGISASGTSFVLIDASYPGERIRWMLGASGARYVIDPLDCIPYDIAPKLTWITPDPNASTRPVEGSPRKVACHLFTSGTTGQPKLITHPDTMLQRFVDWQIGTLNLPDPITTAMISGVAHDPVLRDVFLPLSGGGAIVIPTADQMADPTALRALLTRAGCNVLRLSPSTARLLTAGEATAGAFDNLKAIFWGGERLPRSNILSWQTRVPDARQFSVFGTTETPQAFLIHEICPGEDWARDVPIGRPLPWTGVRVVDADGATVSTGEVGEIVAELSDSVGGIQRRPLTETPTIPHWHCTGDLGYQMPCGNFFFAGRRDGQVKINGFRVELGEIEATAETLPQVERASAVLEDGKLSLFVLSPSGHIAEHALRATLAQHLPGYMMPTQIHVVRAFPSTANGKIDKAALLAQTQGHTPSREAKVAASRPRSLAEARIAHLFARRTGHADVPASTSLFDLGADSLSAIELRLDLERENIALPENWTFLPISELARHQGAGNAAAQGPRPARLIQPQRVETFVILRALAIIAVVAAHTGFAWNGGASIALFALAGYAFGHLQLPAILRDDHAGRVWALITRLLVPLVPMSFLYLAINTYWGNETHSSSLLLHRNLFNLVEGVSVTETEVTATLIWLWFLHVYLQCFAVLGLLLSAPAVRRVLRADPWRGALHFFAVTEVVGLIALQMLAKHLGSLADASFQLHTTPTAILPFLALGALVALAQTPSRRWGSLCLVFTHTVIVLLLYPAHEELWWVGALALCAVLPTLQLPAGPARVLILISAYSLMIYLTHFLSFYIFYKFFGGDGLAAFASVVFQLSVGVAFGMSMRPILEWMGINRIAQWRITFPTVRSSRNAPRRDSV